MAFTLKQQFSYKYKKQINLKFQHSTRGASACAARDQNLFGILDFGYCDLFVICYLLFVFSGLSGLGVTIY
jgi:hypothetical protein